MPTPKLTEMRRGFSALSALLADPDDLPQVFTIIESFGQSSLPRLVKRMQKSAAGRRLLAEQPDIVPVLQDRAALRRLPEGSLGRAYLAFVESENISAEGIVAADLERHATVVDSMPEHAWLRRRLRDTHDLWHAMTGYRGDVLGEAAILGFTLAQSWNNGIALIVGLGLLKTARAPEARRVILDGYRRGQQAAWFIEQPWETMLARPVDEVRRSLQIGPPPAYTPVRSSELKAAAA